ncbi:MAG TPA: DNA-binding protein [Streptosporangiaceae bacterium]
MSAGLSMSEDELRALPVSVPLVVAARAFGMAGGKARELARSGEFPCRVIQVGARWRVPKSALLATLGVEAGEA